MFVYLQFRCVECLFMFFGLFSLLTKKKKKKISLTLTFYSAFQDLTNLSLKKKGKEKILIKLERLFIFSSRVRIQPNAL